MNYVLTIPCSSDLYEVTISGYLIKRIVKYCGESQFRQGDISFNDLSDEAKDAIVLAITENNHHAKT